MEYKLTKLVKTRKIFIIILSNLLCALAINIFFLQVGLLSGGIGGISIMVYYIFGIPTGIIVFLLNVPLFILGFKKVNKSFAILGVLSMLVFSLLLILTKNISRFFIVKDVLIGAIVGGTLNGLGVGLLFRNNMCQDGVDVLAVIMKKKYGISIGTVLLIINATIVLISSILFGFTIAIYTIIAIFVNSKVIDRVRTGFNTEKSILIASEKWDDITNEILKGINRRITLIEGMGAYKRKDIKLILIVIPSQEIYSIKDIVNQIDDKAFFTISDVTEVVGSNFKPHQL